jgi:exodeoxyribonuclease V alpha subunit
MSSSKRPLSPKLAEALRLIKEKKDREKVKAEIKPSVITPSLKERLESLKHVASPEVKDSLVSEKRPEPEHQVTGMHGELITYNDKQQEFIKLVQEGQDCVLIGAAGTGKTTCSQGAIKALLDTNTVPPLQAETHKHLKNGGPGILIVSYTRRAVNNIRKVQSEDMRNNCLTVHKLLEYQPEYFEIKDEETGEYRNTMRFVPARGEYNPLPESIHTIIVEEGSMLSLDLYEKLIAALQHKIQWIFIGDIQQLPPVFGPAILGFKLNELPTVELTEVYRQALESPIIRLAHRVLSGKSVKEDEFEDWKYKDQLTLHAWKKKLGDEHALLTLAAFFKVAIDKNQYDPNEDMILIPYNVGCGTVELNKHIANYLARTAGEVTHEVVAGFNKHYFSVGDKVLFDREDAEILSIEPNLSYMGARYQSPSVNLDYWGHNSSFADDTKGTLEAMAEMDIDFLLEAAASSEERVNQASHTIKVALLDSNTIVTVDTAAEVNNLLHSYALTVHKAQGSEWRKVFVCFHHTHAKMLQRELLYTAITRAREELYVICEPESFVKGITSQKIKGNTLAEKAEYFKGRQKK